MRLVIQRVSKASVEIEGKVNGKIDEGFMLLVGITNDDNKEVVEMTMRDFITIFLKILFHIIDNYAQIK